MPDLKVTLTDDELRRLKAKADGERRTPENLAAHLVAKALKPKKAPTRRKPDGKGKHP